MGSGNFNGNQIGVGVIIFIQIRNHGFIGAVLKNSRIEFISNPVKQE